VWLLSSDHLNLQYHGHAPLERGRMLDVQVLARQQDLLIVVDDFASTANHYRPLRTPWARHRSHPRLRRSRSLPCYGCCARGSSEAASGPCFSRLPIIGLCVSSNTKVWHAFFLMDIVRFSARSWLATSLNWRRACARFLLPICCTHQDNLFIQCRRLY
jgi:hypothetical protein